MRAALVLVPMLIAAAPSADRPLDPETQTKFDKRLAGYVAGKPVSCVPIGYPSLNTTAYGRFLVYQQGSGQLWVNDTGGGCEGAGRGDALVSVQYQGRPCSGDIIRTVDTVSRFNTGSCALRDFVPYTKAK